MGKDQRGKHHGFDAREARKLRELKRRVPPEQPPPPKRRKKR